MTREPLVTSLQGKEIFFLCLRNKNQKKKLVSVFFLFKMRFQNYSTFFSAFHISCILYKSLSTKSAIILDIKEIWNILLEELPGVSKLVLILARVAHIQLQLCARLKSQDFQLEMNIPITLKYLPLSKIMRILLNQSSVCAGWVLQHPNRSGKFTLRTTWETKVLNLPYLKYNPKYNCTTWEST